MSSSAWVIERKERTKSQGVKDFKKGDVFVGRFVEEKSKVVDVEGKQTTITTYFWQPYKLVGDIISAKDGPVREFKGGSKFMREVWYPLVQNKEPFRLIWNGEHKFIGDDGKEGVKLLYKLQVGTLTPVDLSQPISTDLFNADDFWADM